MSTTYEQGEREIQAVREATEKAAVDARLDREASARAKGVELAIKNAEFLDTTHPEWVDVFEYADRVTTYILTGSHGPDDHSAPHHRSR
jgi:hypothetical protein